MEQRCFISWGGYRGGGGGGCVWGGGCGGRVCVWGGGGGRGGGGEERLLTGSGSRDLPSSSTSLGPNLDHRTDRRVSQTARRRQGTALLAVVSCDRAAKYFETISEAQPPPQPHPPPPLPYPPTTHPWLHYLCQNYTSRIISFLCL